MPTVSVVMPLYNKGSTVSRAMNSIFAQTLDDFEVVVVNDGSTDNGPDIVQSYKDPRLRLIQQANAGPGTARNRGIAESSAPYVAFLDADDEWLPGFLESSLTNLLNNSDCALSVVNHFRGKDKTLATEMAPCSNIGIVTGRWRLPPEIGPMQMWGNLIYIQSCGSVMCRREVCLDLGGFYERRCTRGEDLYLWLQVLLQHRIYRDTRPFFWYHTEDSELEGPNRKLQWSLLPFLTDPGPIRKHCPAEYRPALERFFIHAAWFDFCNMVTVRDMSAARYLLRHFPRMKYWVMKRHALWFVKLRVKVACPWLIPHMRAAKALILGG